MKIQKKNNINNQDYKKFEENRWRTKNQKLVFRHKAAYELLLDSGSRSILDIGCGDGMFEEFVKNEQPHIRCVGIDLSEFAVEKARRRVVGVDFLVADVIATGIPFDDGLFDSVIALDVCEHVFNPQEIIREMGRVAKNNLIIGVPNFSSLPARLQTLVGRVPENNKPKKGHAYWFNYWNLLKMLQDEGYSVKAIKMSCQLQRYPIIGNLSSFLARMFPNLFALSFVVIASKTD